MKDQVVIQSIQSELDAVYVNDPVKSVCVPFATLGSEMVSKLPLTAERILVLSDLGLLVAVLRRFKPEQITFVAHTAEQEALSQSLMVKTWQVGYNEPIKELEKLCMGLKFDIIVGNPPYLNGMHVKIIKQCLQHLADDGTCVMVHPSTPYIRPKKEGLRERLEKARKLLHVLTELLQNVGSKVTLRLDTPWTQSETYLDEVVRRAGCELGTTTNNGKVMRTLKLNGRDYLETTTVEHLRAADQKLVDSYGHRSQAAAEAEVDRKSLMHAVRVYQQALELLRTGALKFPRPNAEQLLRIKTTVPLEEVKVLLLDLEAELAEELKKTTLLLSKTPQLEEELNQWMLQKLQAWYRIAPY